MKSPVMDHKLILDMRYLVRVDRHQNIFVEDRINGGFISSQNVTDFLLLEIIEQLRKIKENKNA